MPNTALQVASWPTLPHSHPLTEVLLGVFAGCRLVAFFILRDGCRQACKPSSANRKCCKPQLHQASTTPPATAGAAAAAAAATCTRAADTAAAAAAAAAEDKRAASRATIKKGGTEKGEGRGGGGVKGEDGGVRVELGVGEGHEVGGILEDEEVRVNEGRGGYMLAKGREEVSLLLFVLHDGMHKAVIRWAHANCFTWNTTHGLPA